MNTKLALPTAVAVLLVCLSPARAEARAEGDAVALGAFTGHGDVGACADPGAATYDTTALSYTVTGSGENMWFTPTLANVCRPPQDPENLSKQVGVVPLFT